MRNKTILPAVRRYAIAVPAAVVFMLATVSPASAVSGSASSTFSNGAKLISSIWVETFADSGGCADFSSSAVVSGRHAPVAGHDWVKNSTTFDPWGIAPSVTAFGRSGNPVTGTWTNSNGSRGSFLSGTLCTSFWTLGVEAYITGTAFYNGQTKIVTASI